MKDTRKSAGRGIAIAAAGLIGIASFGAASPAHAAGAEELAALDQLGLLDASNGSADVEQLGAQARSAGVEQVGGPNSYIDGGALVTPSGSQSGDLRLEPTSADAGTELEGVGLYGVDASHSFAFTSETDAAANAGYVIVKDSAAATEFSFDVTYDGQPTVLEQLDEGWISVTSAAGEVVNYFSPAWAVDANGATVETSYSVDGNTLVQHVEHADAAYPVVADPALACDWRFCTVEFTKNETQEVITYHASDAAWVVGACALTAPVSGVGAAACAGLVAAMAGSNVAAATDAKNKGQCFGFRFIPYVSALSFHPVVYSGSNCTGSYV